MLTVSILIHTKRNLSKFDLMVLEISKYRVGLGRRQYLFNTVLIEVFIEYSKTKTIIRVNNKKIWEM